MTISYSRIANISVGGGISYLSKSLSVCHVWNWATFLLFLQNWCWVCCPFSQDRGDMVNIRSCRFGYRGDPKTLSQQCTCTCTVRCTSFPVFTVIVTQSDGSVGVHTAECACSHVSEQRAPSVFRVTIWFRLMLKCFFWGGGGALHYKVYNPRIH